MSHLNYIKTAKNFLRKVARQRKILSLHNAGYLPPSLTNEPDAIIYHLKTINNAAQMHRYIQRKQDIIKMMIPANCTKWFDELRELLVLQEMIEN